MISKKNFDYLSITFFLFFCTIGTLVIFFTNVPNRVLQAICIYLIGTVILLREYIRELSFSFKQGLMMRFKESPTYNYVEKLPNPYEAISLTQKAIPDFTKQFKDDERLNEFLLTLKMLENIGVQLDEKAYFYKGVALFYKKRFEESYNAFQKSLDLRPNVLEVLVNMAVVLGNLGKHDDALAVFKELLKYKENDPEILINTANMHRNLGHRDESMELYKKVENLNTKNPRVLISLAVGYKELGCLDKSLNILNEALKLDPNNDDAWYCKGLTFRKFKQQDEELNAYKKAIELNPNYSEALYNMACIYALRGEKDPAFEYLVKATSINAGFKSYAKTDRDLETLWQDRFFKIITA